VKKFIAMLFVAGLLLSGAVGCSGDKDKEKDKPKPKEKDKEKTSLVVPNNLA